MGHPTALSNDLVIEITKGTQSNQAHGGGRTLPAAPPQALVFPGLISPKYHFYDVSEVFESSC